MVIVGLSTIPAADLDKMTNLTRPQAAAPDSWSSESTERDTQLSIHRTVELRDSGHHAELWPVLRDYAASFAADAQRCCLYVLRQNTRTANSVTVPVELDLTTDCHLGCKSLS